MIPGILALMKSAGGGGATPITPFSVPTGVFYLPASRRLDLTVMEMDDVDGCILGGGWCDFEANFPGDYDFNRLIPGSRSVQTLDAQFGLLQTANANRAGRGLHRLFTRLELGLGDTWFSNGGSRPDWLRGEILSQNAIPRNFYWFVDAGLSGSVGPKEEPVFWEPTLINRQRLLLNALSAHISAQGWMDLVDVVTVLFCSSSSTDFNPGNITHNPDDYPSPGQNLADPYGTPPGTTANVPDIRWQNLLVGSGYTTFADGLLDAGIQQFSNYAIAFPNKMYATSIARINNFSSWMNPGANAVFGRNVCESIMTFTNTNYPGQVMPMKWNLNGGSVQHANLLTPSNAYYDLWLLGQPPYNMPLAMQEVFKALGPESACGADVYMCQRMNQGTGVGKPCADSTWALYHSITTGLTYPDKFIEIYEADIKNLGAGNADGHIPVEVPPVPSDVIHFAHQNLYVP